MKGPNAWLALQYRISMNIIQFHITYAIFYSIPFHSILFYSIVSIKLQVQSHLKKKHVPEHVFTYKTLPEGMSVMLYMCAWERTRNAYNLQTSSALVRVLVRHFVKTRGVTHRLISSISSESNALSSSSLQSVLHRKKRSLQYFLGHSILDTTMTWRHIFFKESNLCL